MLNTKLNDPKLKDKVIYFYSGSHAHKKANAAFLIAAWAILYNNRTPEEAFRPVRGIGLPLWHDATNTACTFPLTVLDTLKGLVKARKCNFFNFQNFDIEEYEYFEQVENGDLNWCVDGKFIAFAGPHATRDAMEGYRALTPDDYIPYFKKKNVTLVIRLNKKYYDARRFTSQGIDHLDLYYLDGSVPPPELLFRFIQKCEETSGAIAVHCKAGLGRTGTCIGCYVMKHYQFTAEEIIGWLRVARPGSIIGPQQQFMKDMQARMWKEGENSRLRARPSLGPSLALGAPRNADRDGGGGDPSDVGSESDSRSDALAPMLPQSIMGGISNLSLSNGVSSNGSISGANNGSYQRGQPIPARDVIPKVTPLGSPARLTPPSSAATGSSLPMISSNKPSSGGSNGGMGGGGESKAKDNMSRTTAGMNRDKDIVGSTTTTSSTGSAKEQGDFLRLRRQQMTDEQQQQSKANIAPPLNNLSVGIPGNSNGLNSPLASSPVNGAVSSPTAASRSAGFTSRFLSSWKK